MFDFLRFYNRAQTYDVDYSVRLWNEGNQMMKISVILPIPRDAEYQRIERVLCEDGEMLTEQKYGNRYAQWNFELAPDEECTVNETFIAHVSARRYEPQDQRIWEANRYVIGYLEYGNPIDGLYSAEEVRRRAEGPEHSRGVDCGGFDTLLQDELRKVGIESRIVAGFWAGYQQSRMHAWLEIRTHAGWIPADPSIEYLRARGRSHK